MDGEKELNLSQLAENSHNYESSDHSTVDVNYVASLAHECRQIEAQLSSARQEISKVEQEAEILRLERKWGYDKEGKRVIPTAEQQALEISEKLVTHPELLEDIVKALRMKRIDLQCNLKELQVRCDALNDEIK